MNNDIHDEDENEQEEPDEEGKDTIGLYFREGTGFWNDLMGRNPRLYR